MLVLAGCVANPVTGQRGAGPVGDEQEQPIGERQYVPGRQMQGGDYLLDPSLVDYVQRVGRRLAAASEQPLAYEFQIVNSSAPNAWALPGGKIAISRGLLYRLESEAQLAAVLGHQVAHAAARQGTPATAAIASRHNDYARYVIGDARLAAQLIHRQYSRSAELEADLYAMLYMDRSGYDPGGAVELQETFLRLSEGGESNGLSGLLASHPPSMERLQASRAAAIELGAGGRVGAQAYLAAIERLRATRPAYEAHDRGRAALADGDADRAMALADEALGMQPDEALFYGLKGDIAFALRNYREAVSHYDQAIARNDRYFKFHLGRGQAHRRLGHIDQAEADLTASARLLPTADAVTALGRIAETNGDVARAIGFFQNAAVSATPAGRTATARLIELDLPRQPHHYVDIAQEVDRTGRVYLELSNRTGIPISDIGVALAYREPSGRAQREIHHHAGVIAAGGTGVMMLGPRYAKVFDTLQAQATSAQPAPD